MILSGDTIKKMIKEEGLVRDEGGLVNGRPYLEYILSNVGPDNLDIRIGHVLLRPKASNTGFIDLHQAPEYEQLTCDIDGSYFLQPGQFCLGTTMEYIKLPANIKAQIDGRSSIGRRGLIIQTAAHIHAGYEGTITLELKNEAPVAIKISPGDLIGQIIFEYLNNSTSMPYIGVYQGQTGTTKPKVTR